MHCPHEHSIQYCVYGRGVKFDHVCTFFPVGYEDFREDHVTGVLSTQNSWWKGQGTSSARFHYCKVCGRLLVVLRGYETVQVFLEFVFSNQYLYVSRCCLDLCCWLNRLLLVGYQSEVWVRVLVYEVEFQCGWPANLHNLDVLVQVQTEQWFPLYINTYYYVMMYSECT